MSIQAKRELLVQVAPRYREANSRQKSVVLDEFVAATGYARKYAISLLTHPTDPPNKLRRRRTPRYGTAVQKALSVAWAAANHICGKRLVPFLTELVPILERHGHLVLTDQVREELLTLSPATADRLLRQLRQKDSGRGISTTRPGSLLKHQVPIRTFADWTETEPGFMEADLVAHCGHRAEGAFLHTLVLTDVVTGWTECLPLLFRTQEAVVQALGRARQLLPVPLLGLDTDNGSEFLNAELIGYCTRERITFTRGRAYKKNDQCFVEQKNGSIVRHLVGYDRFEGEAAYRQLAELYRGVRLYVNFFQPSMKLSAKHREGSRVRRSYDAAQTPYQRLLRSGVLNQDSHQRLQVIHDALDPVRLLEQIGTLQDALWRHAVVGKPMNLADSNQTNPSAVPPPVKFLAAAGGPTGEETALEAMTPPILGQRKYRRTPKPRAPRTWRTRPDPFEMVWGEVTQALAERPELTARLILDQLQKQYPGEYPDNQLRTLQRRVKEWRAGALIQFDDAWLGKEELAGMTLPNPLRASVGGKVGHPLDSMAGVQS